MTEGPFIVGVFQDVAWARRGVDALVRDGFDAGTLTMIALDTDAAADLMRSVLGVAPQKIVLKALGATLAHGSMIATLQGTDGALGTVGLGASMRRAGFQAHDGLIFETLVGRGGVLVAVSSEPRAADALARLHAYGGGNAGIGAWRGRL